MRAEEYFEAFCRDDTEYVPTDIDNAHAADWLQREIPVLECPDEVIERTYYFRFWTYRKHLKWTPDGWVVTEFLPDVPWAGKYNVINCPVGHQLAEGRWLRNAADYLGDYIRFLLDTPSVYMSYSTWFLWGAKDFHDVTGALRLPVFLRKAGAYYSLWEKKHKTAGGLFRSVDDRDGMEYSAAGTVNGKALPGLRPTLNSYMYGDAKALYDLSVLYGRPEAVYAKKAENIRALMKRTLLRDGFYKAYHPQDGNFTVKRPDLSTIPRELIGYIPWYFGINDGDPAAFGLLEDSSVFSAPYGLTTAEQGAANFLRPYDHECLWNGYVWPFATSQALTALLVAMQKNNGTRKKYTPMFFRLLKNYAAMHRRTREDGREVMWIDEVHAPFEKVWTSREILKNSGWPTGKGGFERGKDYNHSTFCDLVIRALSGITFENGTPSFSPFIPPGWDRFCLDNLYIQGDKYRIKYDKTGTHYGKMGLFIYKNGVLLKNCPVD